MLLRDRVDTQAAHLRLHRHDHALELCVHSVRVGKRFGELDVLLRQFLWGRNGRGRDKIMLALSCGLLEQRARKHTKPLLRGTGESRPHTPNS